MKILVCIKAVPEPEDAIYSGKDIPEVTVDDDTDMRMNRFDEFAVEEAVLIKEYFPETVVDVITMGPENAQKTIKRAIGMGADNGIHILSDYHTSCDAVTVSSCIAEVANEKNYDLILCGIMSEDMMQFTVGPMLAHHLSLPWATSVIHETMKSDVQKIYVERELEGGITAMLDINLPALLTIQSGINEPRYPSLSNLLRANKSRINVISVEALQQPESSCRTAGYSYPEKKRDGLILEGTPDEKAEALLRILKEKALV
ncbi:MAG: electron transfer flavoprotein subunit beta/FixA family protein [Desulfobacteraceae bacterium]|nr:electron transfer flavoprotein subunit beta/FixA family protein [Desulfobacteraceae bacterium]MBC2757159.1 electron transfer flavoprotein subunit beta/FixA family protein [Desulfobacteraceae bacterium]